MPPNENGRDRAIPHLRRQCRGKSKTIATAPGNRERRTAWWSWQDPNLQPTGYGHHLICCTASNLTRRTFVRAVSRLAPGSRPRGMTVTESLAPVDAPMNREMSGLISYARVSTAQQGKRRTRTGSTARGHPPVRGDRRPRGHCRARSKPARGPTRWSVGQNLPPPSPLRRSRRERSRSDFAAYRGRPRSCESKGAELRGHRANPPQIRRLPPSGPKSCGRCSPSLPACRRAAVELNARKVATPTRRPWSAMTVIRVRARLAGAS
jgi:hypothetical protein